MTLAAPETETSTTFAPEPTRVGALGSAKVGWPSPLGLLSPNFSLFAVWRWNKMPLGALWRCGPILSRSDMSYLPSPWPHRFVSA